MNNAIANKQTELNVNGNSNAGSNGNQADGYRLEPTTTIADAVKALQAKQIDKDSLIEWLMITPFDLSQTGQLVAVLTGEEVGEVMGKQQTLTAASASASAKSGFGGGANTLAIKIGPKGGLYMFGGKIAAAPNRGVNASACQALGILACGPAIIEAIERAAGTGSEWIDKRETEERKGKDGQVIPAKPFDQPMIGSLKVSSGEKYRAMLAAAKEVYAG